MGILTFVKMQNASGRYAIFQVPGHKERVYIDTALFPGRVTPASISVDGFIAALPVAARVDAEAAKAAMEAAKAEKARVKAEIAQGKAEVRLAKSSEAIAKAKAAAEAALARAAKLTAAISVPSISETV